ncbi:MAG: copper chaperone PCu(A)C [Limnobacter sp.]|nr:copper chaperone PCu(A)C [Limnobacter sp.]
MKPNRLIAGLCATTLTFFATLSAVQAEDQHDKHHSHDMSASELHIMQAWVRPTVPAQKSTGGYMQVMAHADGSIVGATSEFADRTEVHEMSMDGDIMRMSKVESIPMEEGDVISFEPGGYHVMFMGLKQPIEKGQEVSFELLFKDKDGALKSIPVTATATMSQKGAEGHDHSHGNGHQHH